MKNYSLIIWDFNGTLLDDVGAALGSVNDMLARRSKEPITLDEYREYIDVPIRHFYEQVLDLENEDYDLILNEFQQGYEASSSEQSQLERLLKHYEIDGYFDSVLGADNLLAGSKVERAEKFIEEHGVDASKAVVVGDLLHDCDVAKAIGSQCLLITSGHHDRARLESAGVRVEDTLKSFVEEN